MCVASNSFWLFLSFFIVLKKKKKRKLCSVKKQTKWFCFSHNFFQSLSLSLSLSLSVLLGVLTKTHIFNMRDWNPLYDVEMGAGGKGGTSTKKIVSKIFKDCKSFVYLDYCNFRCLPLGKFVGGRPLTSSPSPLLMLLWAVCYHLKSSSFPVSWADDIGSYAHAHARILWREPFWKVP